MSANARIIPVGEEPPPLVVANDKTTLTANNVRSTSDRFAVLNSFVDFSMRNLNGSEIAVWLLLYRDTKKNGIAKVSQADLAVRAGVDVRTVRRALTKLTGVGLVEVVAIGGLYRGSSSYRVHGLTEPNKEGTAVR